MTDSETTADDVVPEKEETDVVEEFLAFLDEDEQKVEVPSHATKNKKNKKKLSKEAKVANKANIQTEKDDSIDEDHDDDNRDKKEEPNNSPPQSSWVFTFMKVLFFMSCLTTLSSGIFVYHTVHNAPNSKLGQLFIKTGHFINELANILTEDINESPPVEVLKVDVKLDTDAPPASIKLDTDASSETKFPPKEAIAEEGTHQRLLGSLFEFISSLTKEDVSSMDSNESDSSNLSNISNVKENVHEAEELVEKDSQSQSVTDSISHPIATTEHIISISQGNTTLFTDISNVLGIFLLFGSLVLRYRPFFYGLAEARAKFLRKEKNRQLRNHIAIFLTIFCMILVAGWLLFFRSSTGTNEVSHGSGGSTNTPISAIASSGGFFVAYIENGLSLSDIIAIIIVVLSLILFVTKQAKRTKPLGRSYLSKSKSA